MTGESVSPEIPKPDLSPRPARKPRRSAPRKPRAASGEPTAQTTAAHESPEPLAPVEEYDKKMLEKKV